MKMSDLVCTFLYLYKVYQPGVHFISSDLEFHKLESHCEIYLEVSLGILINKVKQRCPTENLV